MICPRCFRSIEIGLDNPAVEKIVFNAVSEIIESGAVDNEDWDNISVAVPCVCPACENDITVHTLASLDTGKRLGVDWTEHG